MKQLLIEARAINFNDKDMLCIWFRTVIYNDVLEYTANYGNQQWDNQKLGVALSTSYSDGIVFNHMAVLKVTMQRLAIWLTN